jgi:hypothetical protein
MYTEGVHLFYKSLVYPVINGLSTGSTTSPPKIQARTKIVAELRDWICKDSGLDGKGAGATRGPIS